MKTFYIPVHFYEQDETDDELVMVITQRDIGDAELKNRLTTIKNWYMRKQAEDSDYSEYNEKEIVDAIFDELADELNGTWCYCSTMPRLVIGDPQEKADITGNLGAISIENLACLLIRLGPGDTLYFYESYDENEGISGHIFCATMIKKYESYVVYINCRGGGLPFVFDITVYDEELKELKEKLSGYLDGMDKFNNFVYVDSSFVER